MIDKIFPRKLNRSKDARIQDKTDMQNAVNISIDEFDGKSGDSDTGDGGVIKPSKGNQALPQSLVIEDQETLKVIGSVSDEVNNEVYLFVFSTQIEKQGVYKIDSSESVSAVYLSEHFGFLDNSYVKADVVYGHNRDVILYFTDGISEPKKLNLSHLSDLSLESDARKIDFITACPKTPMHPPTFVFDSDPSKAINFRSVEGFQFAYQCIYTSGEESAISTYSNVAVPPAYLSQGSLQDPDLASVNKIVVTVPQVVNQIENYTSNISKIRLLVRIGGEGSLFVVSEKDPGEDFDFYNDSVLTGVPQEDQDKLNDSLPRKAFTQSIVNDRLIYGNYEEGYETDTVSANFSTRNIERPEDFVDLRVGIRPLMVPAFAEDSNAAVSMNGQDFIPSLGGSPNKVFNRRSAYQFDLSGLPSFLPANSVISLSFSIEPDKNFELYNSENSYHSFRNNGFGLSLNSTDANASPNTRVVKSNEEFGRGVDSGSPAVFQDQSPGVQNSGINWKSTDPGAVEETTSNIKFGTSPSNPLIIPREFVKFNLKFKVTGDVSGSENVRLFIRDVLVGFYSDGAPLSEAHPLAGLATDIEDLEEFRRPSVEVNQLMSSSFGVISDRDERCRTVVSCFSEDEQNGGLNNISPVGFFAINKAKVKFGLRHSVKVNSSISDADLAIGPVLSLHIEDISDLETVTMVPRITRSGERGWIYFNKDFLESSPEKVRKVCLFDSEEFPTIQGYGDINTGFNEPVSNDMNIFFLNDHFCPVTSAQDADEIALDITTDFVKEHFIIPGNFLNSPFLSVTNDAVSDLEHMSTTWRGFQNATINLDSGGERYYIANGSELDNDFRVQGGTGDYPQFGALAFGPHFDGEDAQGNTFAGCGNNANKRRLLGYLDLTEAPENKIASIADPINAQGQIVCSIVDGEVNIRRNGEAGRLNPSYWYGLYYGTEYAGRNNNQFLLSEGSVSNAPVGLLHGDFSYKSFDETETSSIIDELIPDIEVGRKSFSLTTQSVDIGALGRSFKRNCDHSFAILYYDERGRPGEPVPLGSHFVSQVANPGLAHIVIQLTTNPPGWAHSYKILYGGNNSISDFVQYTSAGAFVPKNSDNSKGLIYVSLNHLQENSEISYSKAFGGVNSDGDKDLYTFSEGDRLRIISYFNDPTDPQYPNTSDPFEFQVVGTTTFNDDPSENPLVVEGDVVHPAKTGQFVILKDNQEASGFSFADIAGSLSDQNITDAVYDNSNYWNRRCVFEIYSPQKKREVEARVYHEIGKTYNVIRTAINPTQAVHQTNTILVDQGDVYFRKMAVNMQDYDETSQSFLGLVGDGTDTAGEATSPNFRSFHLESKAFTDIFPNADVLPFGKPRVAIEKTQPVLLGSTATSSGSSNYYRRASSLKFSDRSNSNSNIVRYSSFNDSKLPYKDLQANDGEIFCLINHSDSIFCIQRLKCSSIPVSRNILSDALGNETVISTSKVLGTEKYYAGSYGTDAPESVAHVDNTVYFVSARNKEVYRFNPNSGIEIISDKGMASFFDSRLGVAESQPNRRIVGGFDPHAEEFVLSVTDSVSISSVIGSPGFSNIVSMSSADDYTGVEAFTGGVINEDIDIINDLQVEIFALEGFIEGQNNQITDLVNSITNIQDLLTADLDAIALNGDTIEVTVGGSTETIGPSTVPGAYQAALDNIRAQVIQTIADTIGVTLESIKSVGVVKRNLLETVDAFLPSLAEVYETANSLLAAVDNLDIELNPTVRALLEVDDPSADIASVLGSIGAYFNDVFDDDIEISIESIFSGVLTLSPEIIQVIESSVGDKGPINSLSGTSELDNDNYQFIFDNASSLLSSIPPDISGVVTSVVGQAFTSGEASVDITSDNVDVYNNAYAEGFTNGAASIDTEAFYQQGVQFGLGQADVTVNDEAVAQVAYSDGYNQGYTAGQGSVDITTDNQAVYNEGYAAGQAAVDTTSFFNEGVAAGQAQGFTLGEAAGYEQGLLDGAAGVDITSDNQASYEEGFADGQVDGGGNYQEGYTAGYNVGYIEGANDVDITIDNQASFDAGVASVNTSDIYATAYQAGQDFVYDLVPDLETNAYQQGFQAGEAAAQASGLYVTGFNAGQEAGYQDGFGDGEAAGVASVDTTSFYEQGYLDATIAAQADIIAAQNIGFEIGVASVDITSDNLESYNLGYAAGLAAGGSDPNNSLGFTFSMLLDVMRKGQMTEPQARYLLLILKRRNYAITADTNEDTEIGSSDLLDFLVAYGAESYDFNLGMAPILEQDSALTPNFLNYAPTGASLGQSFVGEAFGTAETLLPD